MPNSLENKRMGGRSLEICPLSPLLPPGFEHLERAVLSSASLDRYPAAVRRDTLPLPCLPMQFREFPGVQGKA